MANELIIPVKYVLDGSDLDKAAQKLGVVTSEEKKLEAEMNDVAAAARKQTTEFYKAGDAGVKAAKDPNNQFNLLGKTMGSLGNIIAGVFAIDTLLNFGKQVINVTAEFQKMQAVLTTSLGSESAAQQAFARIQQFASETPYSVAQVTESFVKLAARGFVPTNDQLRQLGDLAASTGKDFNQLVEAILDAQTGEFERLKEFGVRASAEGDKVKFTFKGVTTEVEKTDDAIKNYVLTLGDLQGVSGSMASISETLGGKISNLGDAVDNLFYTIGQGTDGPLSGFISGLTTAVNVMSRFLEGEDAEKLRRVADALKETGFNPSQITSIDEAKKQIAALTTENEKLAESFKKNLSSDGGEEGFFDSLITKAKLIAQGLPITTIATADLTDKVKEARIEYEANAAMIEQLTARIKELGKTQEQVAAKPRVKIALPTAGENGPLTDEQRRELDGFKILEQAIKNKERAQREANLIGAKSQEELEEKNLIASRIALTERRDLYLRYGMDVKEIDEQLYDDRKKLLDKEVKDDKDATDEKKKHQQELNDLRRAGFEVALLLGNGYLDYQYNSLQVQKQNLEYYYSREIALAGDNNDAKAALEREYQKKQAEIKTKEAINEKNSALFNIAVSGAERFVEAMPNPILMALVATTTAIQAAFVAARPIPKFAKGTRSVTGGTPGEDSVLAMLMPGERVVTTDKNRQLGTAFDVLTDSKRSPQFWNKTLLEIEKLGVFTPPRLHDLPGINQQGSIDTDRIVNAVKGIVIQKNNWNEKGFTQYLEEKGRKVRFLNKHYGF